MKKIFFILTLVVLTILGCEQHRDKKTKTNQEWYLVYSNDKDGKTSYGDKSKLISAIRKGYPIRVGWAASSRSDTTKTVEHVVDAEFLTIANGNEVFAQIRPFLAQRPDLISDTLSMRLLPVQSNWVLGTNGIISSVNMDYGKDTISTSPPKLFGYGLNWFTSLPNASIKEMN